MKLTPINPHFNACDQKWELMPEQDGGRRCGECERVLVDFTPFGEQEVLNRQRESGFNICGRYTKTQVDRLHRHLAQEEGQSHKPWLVSLAMGAGSLLPLATVAQDKLVELDQTGTTASKIEIAMSGKIKAPRTDTTEAAVDSIKIPIAYTAPLPGAPRQLQYPVLQTKPETKTVEIRGTVVDKETGEAIPFAIVYLENTDTGTTTDFDGNFTLTVPMDSNEVVLNAACVGYVEKSEPISLNSVAKTEIKLELETRVLGFVGIVAYPATPGQKLKYWSNPANWYRRIKNRILY